MQHTIQRWRRNGAEIASVALSGAASYEGIASLLRDLESIAASGVRHFIIDESDLTPGLITPAEIRRIASMFQESRSLGTARVAVIAPSPVIYGLNRMVHGFASDAVGERIAIFRAVGDGLAWLVPA
ncbi:MAG TPA: hypothetical protein VGH28_23970 [Polyangiaceae bacterium]|jgi:hypothetical protein